MESRGEWPLTMGIVDGDASGRGVKPMEVEVGDVIEVHSRKVGGAVRRGTVLDVSDGTSMQLRVEWEDGRESVLYPSAGMVHVTERGERA